MKTTMTINLDGTVSIPLLNKQGVVMADTEFPPTSGGAGALWQFACHNEMVLGEVVSEDTMVVFLKDHPPRR